MVKRLRWVIIPYEDFDKLDYAFDYCRSFCGDYGSKLIELAEKYKSYATEYNGRRYVFVSVRNMNDIRDGLAGFVVYDKSSKEVLFSRYTSISSRRYDAKGLAYYRLMLRLAMDNRLDVFEYLLRVGFSESDYLLTFFGLCYKYFGDEFIDYLYRSYKDIPDRFERNKLIYGRNFVIIPRIRVGDYGEESVGLIRAGDGSIILLRSPDRLVRVRKHEYPLFHEFFSYLIDYAEDLEKNMVFYEDECKRHWCSYIVFSSASPPHWWRSSAVALMGWYEKNSFEKFDEVNILFINCDNYCSIYLLGEVVNYLTSKHGEYRKYDVEEVLSLHRFSNYIHRFIEYVIAYRDRFPQKFVEEAYKHYLYRNVMNVL
ncbi:MAG: hypothetical protein C0179_05510 [Fervidicoccus sp.]|nr:MAG: hypothetical protein C0179_05510 [Fervidicoccus sp.]